MSNEIRMSVGQAKEKLKKMQREYDRMENTSDPMVREHRAYLSVQISSYRLAIADFEANEK